jgi:hypothetical protein
MGLSGVLCLLDCGAREWGLGPGTRDVYRSPNALL